MKLKSKLNNKMMVLVSKNTGEELHIGDRVKTFRDEEVVLLGGEPPRSEASSGRVFVENENFTSEFYPSVIDAEWRTA